VDRKRRYFAHSTSRRGGWQLLREHLHDLAESTVGCARRPAARRVRQHRSAGAVDAG
jgi:hypothetical protein